MVQVYKILDERESESVPQDISVLKPIGIFYAFVDPAEILKNSVKAEENFDLAVSDLIDNLGVKLEAEIQKFTSANNVSASKFSANGYPFHDLMKCDAKDCNLQEKLKIFYKEHFHEDDEVRYVISGGGFFDVRDHFQQSESASDSSESWYRIVVDKGDFLILPAGIYHRFSISPSQGHIIALRLFQSAPKWTPINRADLNTQSDATTNTEPEKSHQLEVRNNYLQNLPF